MLQSVWTAHKVPASLTVEDNVKSSLWTRMLSLNSPSGISRQSTAARLIRNGLPWKGGRHIAWPTRRNLGRKMNFPSSTWGDDGSNVKRRRRPELGEEVREVDIRPDWDRRTTGCVGAEPHSWPSCLSNRSKRSRVHLPELLSRHATCCNPGAADPQGCLLCPPLCGTC